jgi:hypothetical protein
MFQVGVQISGLSEVCVLCHVWILFVVQGTGFYKFDNVWLEVSVKQWVCLHDMKQVQICTATFNMDSEQESSPKFV